MSVEWDVYDRFEAVIDRYMPKYGEGETLASQICTAVNKLVYKWYNDGDVFDNTCYLSGWYNDLSSYANWFVKYIPKTADILDGIFECETFSDYEDLLLSLAVCLLTNEVQLEEWDKIPAKGSVYRCDGKYRFEEIQDDEEW